MIGALFRNRPWLVGALAGGLAVLGLATWLDAGSVPPPAVPGAAIDRAKSEVRPDRAGLETVACWFALPTGRAARCGVLTVPERWGDARSRPLHLRFVVFRADPSAGAGDPVIYLGGGPGEPAQIDEASIRRWWEWTGRTDWLKKRDVVVFDYRGVGLSDPAMSCPELADSAYRVFSGSLTPQQTRDAWSGAAGHCRERLQAAGIDLASYNTEAIVQDLHSLIEHLGYRSWNLLAVSYGTRVALAFVDRWHEGTRAAVLDSVYPANINAYVDGARAVAASFAGLFKECHDDRACREAFPDLASTFDQVLRRAATTPVAVSLAVPPGKAPREGRLDNSTLTEVLFQAFYDWRDIAELPATITLLAQGDTRPLEGLTRRALDSYASARVSHGLFFSVECHDEFPLNRRDDVERAAAGRPLYRDFVLSNLPLTVCPTWPAGRIVGSEGRPARSDVPILMLSGELDPVTPPQWGKAAAASLRNAVRVEFRGVGHGVLEAHHCASLIVARFLEDPMRSPLDDCLLAVGPPRFRTVPARR
jgi:pimeloyl-ACP methyl ester carboxylesterase